MKRLAALTVFFCLPCLGQTGAGGGTIVGTVKDATDAAIPGAKVNILHLETNRAYNAIANHEGYFVTPTLAIGKYKIRVEHEGMKSWEGELALETGQTVEIAPKLSPGNI